jgi:hypothetical protein
MQVKDLHTRSVKDNRKGEQGRIQVAGLEIKVHEIVRNSPPQIKLNLLIADAAEH